MRHRLRKFLPIVLFALMAQILEPIGACWAAGIAASDPLRGAVICHGDMAGAGQTGQTDPAGAHQGSCSVCSVLHTGAPLGTPPTAVTALFHPTVPMLWYDSEPELLASRAGSHAQARAPPQLT
jgi:hypothetical protein